MSRRSWRENNRGPDGGAVGSSEDGEFEGPGFWYAKRPCAAGLPLREQVVGSPQEVFDVPLRDLGLTFVEEGEPFPVESDEFVEIADVFVVEGDVAFGKRGFRDLLGKAPSIFCTHTHRQYLIDMFTRKRTHLPAFRPPGGSPTPRSQEFPQYSS